jgi:hypothetical protein
MPRVSERRFVRSAHIALPGSGSRFTSILARGGHRVEGECWYHGLQRLIVRKRRVFSGKGPGIMAIKKQQRPIQASNGEPAGGPVPKTPNPTKLRKTSLLFLDLL